MSHLTSARTYDPFKLGIRVLWLPSSHGSDRSGSTRKCFSVFGARRPSVACIAAHVSLRLAATWTCIFPEHLLRPPTSQTIWHCFCPDLRRCVGTPLLGCHILNQRVARNIATVDAVLGGNATAGESRGATISMNDSVTNRHSRPATPGLSAVITSLTCEAAPYATKGSCPRRNPRRRAGCDNGLCYRSRHHWSRGRGTPD